MAVAIFKIFIKVITTFSNILFYPFIITFEQLIPSFPTLLSSIQTLLSHGVYYAVIVRDLFCIPIDAITILFDYFLIKYSIFLLRSTIHFTVTVYDKFKL